MEEEEEEDFGFRLTLFSDIKQNFKDIRETVSERVFEALEKDLLTNTEENAPENAISVVDSIDNDDVPLAERRLQLIGKNDSNILSTERTLRSHQRSRRKETEQKNSSTQAVIGDTVDLVDSDSEVECIAPELLDGSFGLDTSEYMDSSIDEIIEDENTLVSIKVNWMDLKVHRFAIRKHQTFTTVFDELAEKENVPRERILLILRDKIFITKEDTPDTLKLSIIDIIEGGITKEIYKNMSQRKDAQEMGKDMLEFKCLLKDQKKPLSIYIKKTDTMHHLMVKAAEQLECQLEKLKFMFEGEQLDDDVTPIDLDLEGGEIIDVVFKK